MGVYIKSMKMPEDGHILSLVLKSDGKVIGANYGEVLGKAVEIHPHGRLIDADLLYNYICTSINAMTEIGFAVDGDYLWGLINNGLDTASTVIEAEEDE